MKDGAVGLSGTEHAHDAPPCLIDVDSIDR
jgi:hypothetical protein